MDKYRSEFLVKDSKSIDKLLLILKDRAPRSCMLYNVTKLERDKKFSEKVKIQFYSKGESLDDIFILAIMTLSYFNDNVVFLSSPGGDIPEEFAEMIENTLDWNLPHTFGDLNSTEVPVVDEICRKNGNPVDANEYFYYYMDIEAGKKLLLDQIPDTVEVKQLSVSNSEKVNEKWGFAAPGLALPMVQDSIETMAGIGVFEKVPEDDGLVSWLIISPASSFNALHTEEKFRGKGFGNLALKSMVKFATDKLGIFPVCHVELKNDTSKRLMEKVGLKQGENIYWMDFKRNSKQTVFVADTE